MRLTEKEKNVLISVVSEHASKNSELRLFGSRTDDSAKGGDIDLLLLVADEYTKKALTNHKIEILVKIKNLIGDQKIDMIIATSQGIAESAFLSSVFPESVCLKKW